MDNINHYYSCPILFLIFNRPDTTSQVFEEIKKIKPKKLFIAADGPRDNRPDDIILCEETRRIVNKIDWECELFTLFHNTNIGCKLAVSTAITWFFSFVEEGIILEDDCVPDDSFFHYCAILLEKYKDDERVMMISGTNFLFQKYDDEDSYFFSKYYPMWGWATWKRAWNLYDISMQQWPFFHENNQLQWIYSNRKLVKWFEYMFQIAYENKIDTWDIQWWYSCIFQNGLSIVPKYNLVSNIGVYGHFTDGSDIYMPYIRMPVKSIEYNELIHPHNIIENAKYDRMTINQLLKDQKVPIKYKINKCKNITLIKYGISIYIKINSYLKDKIIY